jgi:hypothetical protein
MPEAMPAVELARLKNQIAAIAADFTRPDEFRRGVSGLFYRYGMPSFRSVVANRKSVKTPSFHVPPVVVRYLVHEVRILSQENQLAAIQVGKELWAAPQLEMKELAATVLGEINLDHIHEVVEFLKIWAQPGVPPEVLVPLFEHGGRQLRTGASTVWLSMIEDWVSENEPRRINIGLLAILCTIGDADFQNIPALFRILTPILLRVPDGARANLDSVMAAMVSRVPIETIQYFKRIILTTTTSASTLAMIRKQVPLFREEDQAELHQLFRDRKTLSEDNQL